MAARTASRVAERGNALADRLADVRQNETLAQHCAWKGLPRPMPNYEEDLARQAITLVEDHMMGTYESLITLWQGLS